MIEQKAEISICLIPKNENTININSLKIKIKGENFYNDYHVEVDDNFTKGCSLIKHDETLIWIILNEFQEIIKNVVI